MKRADVELLVVFVLSAVGNLLYSVCFVWRIPRLPVKPGEMTLYPYPPASDPDFPDWCKGFIAIEGTIAFAIVILTLYVVVRQRYRRKLLEHLLGFWVLAPPFWSGLEYFLVFRPFGNHDAFEGFKYAQDLGLRLWVGGVGFLMAILWQAKEEERRKE